MKAAICGNFRKVFVPPFRKSLEPNINQVFFLLFYRKKGTVCCFLKPGLTYLIFFQNSAAEFCTVKKNSLLYVLSFLYIPKNKAQILPVCLFF